MEVHGQRHSLGNYGQCPDRQLPACGQSGFEAGSSGAQAGEAIQARAGFGTAWGHRGLRPGTEPPP
eukprot:13338877-Alexandrium_andersonii.AAC.1